MYFHFLSLEEEEVEAMRPWWMGGPGKQRLSAFLFLTSVPSPSSPGLPSQLAQPCH